MKCSTQKHSDDKFDNTLSMANVMTSVNNPINNLSSEDCQPDSKQPELTAAAAAAAAEIDKQLDRLDRLFAKANERRRKKRHHSCLLQQHQQPRNSASAKREDEYCNRSVTCSSCTKSNCNSLNTFSISESSDGTIRAGTAKQKQQQLLHLVSVESSSDESIWLISGNSLNDNKKPECLTKSAKRCQQLPDFTYLKAGLSDGVQEKPDKTADCGNAIMQIERMVKSLKLSTDLLDNKFKQRQRQKSPLKAAGCTWSTQNSRTGLKAKILQAQTRAACLRRCLQAALRSAGVDERCGSFGNGLPAVSCRHRGTATHLTRDAISDIKCKFERSLLFNRFDVNWPFLHIIAPSGPSFDQRDD